MKSTLLFTILLISSQLWAQTFTRSELPLSLDRPWEITYGQDGYLWLTERNGRVTRVHPTTGIKQDVYQALDYFSGSELERLQRCYMPSIKAGTLGLALHPDFPNDDGNYIYFVYSYNSGTDSMPSTKFRIKRLTWDKDSEEVIGERNIVNSINTSYDHLGGRLMAVKQNGKPYLFLTIGDHGPSEMNDPDCYDDQTQNPNNYTQNLQTVQGKIHRFNMDGSIPEDNPIAGNSFYSRGHRNPQGLAYNSQLEILYSIEHGDRTDDEINRIEKGMNYGWRDVRGYHYDDNHEGEADYIYNYQPHPDIANDRLVEAMYSWCAESPFPSFINTDWCTVAPSDGIYYGSTGIPQWQNSLLVVTLKKSETLDIAREVYQFKLLPDGELAPSTRVSPNPRRFFGEDQHLNGRLRDITISPDGKNIYLINNLGASTDKITVYTVNDNSLTSFTTSDDFCVKVSPNPISDAFIIQGLENFESITSIQMTSIDGRFIKSLPHHQNVFEVSDVERGIYIISIVHADGICHSKIIKE